MEDGPAPMGVGSMEDEPIQYESDRAGEVGGKGGVCHNCGESVQNREGTIF